MNQCQPQQDFLGRIPLKGSSPRRRAALKLVARAPLPHPTESIKSGRAVTGGTAGRAPLSSAPVVQGLVSVAGWLIVVAMLLLAYVSASEGDLTVAGLVGLDRVASAVLDGDALIVLPTVIGVVAAVAIYATSNDALEGRLSSVLLIQLPAALGAIVLWSMGLSLWAASTAADARGHVFAIAALSVVALTGCVGLPSLGLSSPKRQLERLRLLREQASTVLARLHRQGSVRSTSGWWILLAVPLVTVVATLGGLGFQGRLALNGTAVAQRAVVLVLPCVLLASLASRAVASASARRDAIVLIIPALVVTAPFPILVLHFDAHQNPGLVVGDAVMVTLGLALCVIGRAEGRGRWLWPGAVGRGAAIGRAKRLVTWARQREPELVDQLRPAAAGLAATPPDGSS